MRVGYPQRDRRRDVFCRTRSVSPWVGTAFRVVWLADIHNTSGRLRINRNRPFIGTKRPCEYRITRRTRPRPSFLTIAIHSAPSRFDGRLSTREPTTRQQFALEPKQSLRQEPPPAQHARPRTIPHTAFQTAFGVDFHTSVVTPPFCFVPSASHRARTGSLTPLRSIDASSSWLCLATT